MNINTTIKFYLQLIYKMSLHQQTQQVTPAMAKAIPPGKFIAEDERFMIQESGRKLPYVLDQDFARQGLRLRPAQFQYAHLNPTFTPIYQPAPQMEMNYGTYIFNKVDGYQ
jgi:hypothetical protein